MLLTGHSALISGGASGLGRATAALLASRGMRVVIADLQEDIGHAAAADIGCEFVRCDVTQANDVAAAVRAAQALAPLRVAVSCAGIAPAARTLGKQGPHALELFQRVIDINLVGSFNLARLAAETMAQQAPLEDGERGVIVNTASVAAFDGQIGQVAYAASKAGAMGLTVSLARECGALNITANCIAPGYVESDMLAKVPEKIREDYRTRIPMRRFGDPAEIAAMAAFLASDECAFLTGQCLVINGGLQL